MIAGSEELPRELTDNLIDNALRYTPAGGIVTVRVARIARGSVLEIEDTAPEIAPAERERVLEHFYRTEGTTGEGCGLGLAITREIATLHNASITIEAGENDRGTRIRIVFPEPCPL